MGWVEHWSSYISSLDQSTEQAHYNQSLSYYSALSKSLNPSLESISHNNFTTQPDGQGPVHSYALKFVMVNLAQGNSTEHAIYICPSTSCNVLTLLFLYSSSTSCLLTLILLLLSYTAMIVLCFMLCQVCWFRCCFKRKGGDPTDSGVIPHRRKRRRPQNIDQEHRKKEQEKVLQVMVISSQQQEKPKSITKVITLSTESFKGAIQVDQKDEQAKDSISKLKQNAESRSDFRIQETVVEESGVKEFEKVSAKDSVKVSGKDSAKESPSKSVKKKSKMKSTRGSLSHPIQGSQVDEALPVDTVILHVASPTSLTGMESASSTVGSSVGAQSSVEPQSPIRPQSPIGPIEQSPPINFPISSTGRILLSPITSPNAPPLVHSPNTESLRRVMETSRRPVERSVREMSSEVPAIVLEPYVHELGAEMVRQGMPKRMPEAMVVGGGAKVKPLDSSSESSESSLYNYM